MKIEISSSQSEIIDEKYKESARRICEFLASNNCDLIWGSGCRSIMGICYEEFSKKDRKIYGFTTNKYTDEIKELPNATHEICDNTFDLKKEMFNKADVILCLPGGTGTISELFTYIEEERSNDIFKKLVIYNEFGHFNSTIDCINDMIVRSFNTNSIYKYFEVANNFDEFKIIFNKIKKELK